MKPYGRLYCPQNAFVSGFGYQSCLPTPWKKVETKTLR
jgi:hypothetical protein